MTLPVLAAAECGRWPGKLAVQIEDFETPPEGFPFPLVQPAADLKRRFQIPAGSLLHIVRLKWRLQRLADLLQCVHAL